MIDATSVVRVFNFTSWMLVICVLISTAEYLALIDEFDSCGAFSWWILGSRSPAPKTRIVGWFRERPFGRRGTAVQLIVRLASAIALLAAVIIGKKALAFVALLGVFVSSIVLVYRCAFGTDGSDQMATVVAIGLLVASVPSSTSHWALLGFGFIGAQSCLAYLASGLAKATSPVWRDGTAIYGIMNTGAYGHAALARLLRHNARLCLLLCWGVITFETAFPASLFLPSRIVLGVFAVGILFHIGNAFFMGLNTFLWSFVATYPSVWMCGLFAKSHLITGFAR